MIFPTFLLLRLIRSAAGIWLILRIAGVFLGVGLFSPPEIALVCSAVLAICWLDIKASREPLLFQNLAISSLRVSWVILSSALALDLTAALLIGLVRGQMAGG